MSTYSFNFLPLGSIRFAYEDAFLVAGTGSHRLALKFDVSASWLTEDDSKAVIPLLVTGEAWTTNPGPCRPLCGLRPATYSVRGYPMNGDIIIDLSDEQLVAIEDLAGDNDICINLKLKATMLLAEPAVHPVMDQEFDVRIKRHRWLELLDQVGAGATLTLRVPSPLTDADGVPRPALDAATAKSLSQATARLREARRQLRDRHWEQCVATCRKVLENIEMLAVLPTQASLKSIPAMDRTKDERWAAMFYDVKSLAHAAHHEGADIHFDQVDANALLAASAALLLRYTT